MIVFHCFCKIAHIPKEFTEFTENMLHHQGYSHWFDAKVTLFVSRSHLSGPS